MINETKAEKLVLTNNGSALVGRNAAGTADIEIARVNASNEVEVAAGANAIKLSGSPLNWTGTNNHKLSLKAQNAGDADLHTQTGTLSLETTTGTIAIGTTNHARTVSVATGNADQAVAVGSSHGASALTLAAGTGAIGIGTSASARAINIGTGAAVQTIGIGTGAAANVLTLGSETGAASLALKAGTGGVDIATGAQARTINVGTGAAVQTINVGTGAAANAITIGSTNTSATTTITAGTGFVNMTARTNVKAAAGLYVTEATGANGISIVQQSGTTHTLGVTGTTTTLRMGAILEMNANVTALTDKSPNLGTVTNRFNTITCQTTQEKTHDAFTGSAHVTATAAVQTTNSTTTTLYTSPTILDESGTWVEVHVSGHDTGGTNRGYAVRRALISRDGGGGATVVGSVNDAYSNLPGGVGGWGGGVALTAVNIDTTGNTFRVRVQGASATINWTCTVRYQTVSQNS